MEFANRLLQYIKEHADEIGEIVEARSNDSMTEEENNNLCKAVVCELMHIDGAIKKETYEQMAKIKKITLTEEEFMKHAKNAITNEPPHNKTTVVVVDEWK